jgi:hypothetical protein
MHPVAQPEETAMDQGAGLRFGQEDGNNDIEIINKKKTLWM